LPSAAHDEALVEPHQVRDVVLGQQVVADGDAHGVAAAGIQRVVHEGRIQRDVAVVADEQAGLGGIRRSSPLTVNSVVLASIIAVMLLDDLPKPATLATPASWRPR
jgi:hypothetical protein